MEGPLHCCSAVSNCLFRHPINWKHLWTDVHYTASSNSNLLCCSCLVELLLKMQFWLQKQLQSACSDWDQRFGRTSSSQSYDAYNDKKLPKFRPRETRPNNRPILRLINLFSKPVLTKFSATLLFVHPQQGHPEEDGRNVFFSSTAKYHLAWPSWWASWGLLYFFYFFF